MTAANEIPRCLYLSALPGKSGHRWRVISAGRSRSARARSVRFKFLVDSAREGLDSNTDQLRAKSHSQGVTIVGPPTSFQVNAAIDSTSNRQIPGPLDEINDPCLAALVTSSWNKRMRCRAFSDRFQTRFRR